MINTLLLHIIATIFSMLLTYDDEIMLIFSKEISDGTNPTLFNFNIYYLLVYDRIIKS